MKVVSLLASPYSGSTILSMALGSHPDVAAFGDTYFSPAHPAHRCSCGAPFKECPLRQRLNRRMADYGFPSYWDTAQPLPGGGPWLERPYLYLKRRLGPHAPSLRHALDVVLAGPAYRARFVREQHAFLAALEAETGAVHYFDGCKSPARAALMLDAFPDTKILHLIRDPRGYLASFAKHFEQRSSRPPSADEVETAFRWWRRDNALAAAYERELPPDRYLRVQYAELISDPEATLRRIGRFIGIDGTRDPCSLDRSRLHVSGNTTNLVSTRIERRRLGGWRDRDAPLDWDRIEARARRLSFIELEPVR